MTDNQEIIDKMIDHVKKWSKDLETGHDWWHTHRVWRLARHIAKYENANLFVVELGALLHDIADYKFYDGDETVGPLRAEEFLISLNVDKKIILQVKNIIKNISFKGVKYIQKYRSVELGIVQDADRLDAMGAIGIARAFNYGGYMGMTIYDPDIKPDNIISGEKYIRNRSTTINHFYEKLLVLKDLMNTKTGKILAKDRHRFMKQYLDKFYEEWG